MSIAGVFILAVLLISVPRTINKIDFEKFKNAQDYTVPLFNNSEKNKTALFIFPHPDDEVVCGGTIDQMKKKGWTIDLLTLTKGQLEEKATRTREWENAVKELQIDHYEIMELLNNSWENVLKNDIEFWYDNQDSIENLVYRAIQKYKPSIVFTFDTVFGAYGHPEHRISAIAVNNVFQKHKADSTFSVEKILQVTFPEKLEQLVFGSSESYKNAMKYTGNITLPDPTIAFNISNNGTVKRKAAAAYVSQAVGLKRTYLLPELADTAIHYSTFDREYYFEIRK
jgi:LmbE family N-acetylglucosaminyl deacetylase